MGIYVCGHARDKGQPGRCTPGDDRCNNYCNLAPQKGPVQAAPAECPVEPKPTEFAWLIEVRPLVEGDGGPFYYGANPKGGLGCTTDNMKAIRFARKEDAEAMIVAMGWANMVAVEHGWG